MRYIDADKLIEHIHNMPWKMDSAAEITKFIFLSTVEEAPTADVVPKSEVEQLKLEYAGFEAGVRQIVQTAKSEVAMEIFEEIEKETEIGRIMNACAIVSLDAIAELKKKYTEGKEDEGK